MKCEVEHLMITDGHGFRPSAIPSELDGKSEKTKEIRAKVCDMYDKHKTVLEIAEEMQRSAQSVYQILRSQGYELGPRVGPKKGKK